MRRRLGIKVDAKVCRLTCAAALHCDVMKAPVIEGDVDALGADGAGLDLPSHDHIFKADAAD